MERRAVVPAIAVFAATLVAGGVVVRHIQRLDLESHRRAAHDLASGSAFAIEREFARSLASASALAAMVAEGASDAQLNRVAARLLELHGGTSNLQLARDGVISHMWPSRGNEAAFGLDLLRHPIHGAFTRAVRETGRPVLYGPFELVQGGAGLALRVPVQVRDERGGERFWGFASAIVRLEVLLEESRLPRLAEAGFDYDLRRSGPPAPGQELLATSRASGETPLEAPVSVSIELPGQTWLLDVAPKAGWSTLESGALHLAVFVIAVLAAMLAYRIVSLPEVLRREVSARTAELEVAHREQRRAEEAQRQSQKLEAIGLLAGGVAHDFNNLLVGILGYAELVAAEAPPGSLAEEAGQAISQAAQRAGALTRQLLAFARIGPQRQVQVDVHALAHEVAGLLGRTLDKSIRIELRLSAPVHHVRGDPGDLQQVVLNLAVNARDAMPEGGTLTLETSVEEVDEGFRGLAAGRYVVLSVADTGLGIPRENLERIFEPFFTTKGEGRGTGLGLATVYGIVKGHGGSVRVYSEEGVGSRFLVYLPVQAEPAAAQPAVEPAPPHGTGVVLVVDDEEIVRATAGRMLASLGFEPVLVSGGQAALEWLGAQAAAPAAVLLDLSMPGMDGRACFRLMRERFPGVRVIISSGFSRNGRAQELLDEGAVEFVQKPYRTAELARALAVARGAAA